MENKDWTLNWTGLPDGKPRLDSGLDWTCWAQRDRTLQETFTFTDKNKIVYNFSDPGGTLEKLKQPKTII